MTAPKRRWFAYSLRTMFVCVTVVACWLGYSLNWLRQRHAVIEDSKACHEYSEPRSAPGLLWLFGEPGYEDINPRYYTSNWHPFFGPAAAMEHRTERQRIRALFPEVDHIELDLQPPKMEPGAMRARLAEISDREAEIAINPMSMQQGERWKLIHEREILEERLYTAGMNDAEKSRGPE